jgi:hypothetical protein
LSISIEWFLFEFKAIVFEQVYKENWGRVCKDVFKVEQYSEQTSPHEVVSMFDGGNGKCIYG